MSNNTKFSLSKELKYQWHSLIIASLFAILLGLFTAILMNLVGPAFVLLKAEPNSTLTFKELFGKSYNNLYLNYFNLNSSHTFLAKEILFKFPLFLLIIAACKAFLAIGQRYLWETLAEKTSLTVRQKCVNSYLYLNPNSRQLKKFKKIEANLASNISNDIKMMREYIVRFYGGLPRESFQIIFLIINLLILDSYMFFLFFIIIVPSFVIIAQYGRKLRKRNNKALENYADLSEWIQQRLYGLETIKHYKTESLEIKKMQANTELLFKKLVKVVYTKARTSPIIEIFTILAIITVFYLASKRVLSNASSTAVQISFFASIAALSQALTKLGGYFNTNKESGAALHRITNIIETLQTNENHKLNQFSKQNHDICINLSKISYKYADSTSLSLNDISYKFKYSNIYVLKGKSGAGKSTLIKALLGLLDLHSGSITHNILHSKITYLPQQIDVIPDSIANNVIYPEKFSLKTNTKNIWHALEKVNLAHLVKNLKGELNFALNCGSQTLSGGEKQRLLLSRLWYHDAKLIIIDEGTSALDVNTETLITSNIQQLRDNGACVILSAHRKNIFKGSNKVIELEGGKIL